MINWHSMSEFKNRTKVIKTLDKKNLYFHCHYLGESSWWTIHPASKQRSEGEKVRAGDDVILVSVATERYLVVFTNFDYHIDC